MTKNEMREMARESFKNLSGKEIEELTIDELFFYIAYYADKLHDKTHDDKYRKIKNVALQASKGMPTDEIIERLEENYKSEKEN